VATLHFGEWTDDGAPRSSVSLREWLEGRWTIVFSHPDDFVRCELEIDRWLGIVGDAFRQARIRPLAVSRSMCPVDAGWVSQLSRDHRVVSLFERGNARSLPDLNASRLRAFLERMDRRYVAIIDSRLHARWTLLYTAAELPPFPPDLVRLACRIRSAEAPDSRPVSAVEETQRARTLPSRRLTACETSWSSRIPSAVAETKNAAAPTTITARSSPSFGQKRWVGQCASRK